MKSRILMAIDQGTTGSTVLVIDAGSNGQPRIIGRQNVEFKQYYPKPGWVEHDLNEIWQSVLAAMAGALEQAKKERGIAATDIGAIGITNQRETLCCFDRQSSEPLRRAIVWQDKRSHEICQRLKDKEEFVRSKTGLVLDPYFTGTKMTWLMENDPIVRAAIREKKALFGTIDTFLLHKMTGAATYASEPSNASRTLLYDLKAMRFDPELVELFGLPHLDCLPEVKDSAGIFGTTKGVPGLPDGIAISGVLGDQQAALAGQTCFASGDAKCTYGTGAFMLRNIGSDFKLSQHGLLTTVAWSINGVTTYAFEGAAFIAGAAIQFLRDQLDFLQQAEQSQTLAKGVLASPDLYFVPALSGLGAPYWLPEAKGAFLGMTRGTSKNQLIRAALEGICFTVRDLYLAMQEGVENQKQISLRVDGGAAANDLLMQFQSDILEVAVDRPKIIETTAFGAALFAGLGAGLYSGLDEIADMREVDQLFQPQQDKKSRELIQLQLSGWQNAIKAVMVFAKGADSETTLT